MVGRVTYTEQRRVARASDHNLPLANVGDFSAGARGSSGEVGEAADGADAFAASPVDDNRTSGAIGAIFGLPQASDEDWNDAVAGGCLDDAIHGANPEKGAILA